MYSERHHHTDVPMSANRARYGALLWTLFMAFLLLSWSTARASERLEIVLSTSDGLPVDTVREVVFDEDGYLWAATSVGVARFDGRRFALAVPDAVPHAYFALVPRQGGGLWVRDRAGRISTLLNGEMRPIEAPPLADRVRAIAADGTGDLWAIQEGQAWRRDSDGAWKQQLYGLLNDGERVLSAVLRDQDLILATSDGIFAVRDGHAERWLTRTPRQAVVTALREDDGSLLVLTFAGELERWTDGQRTLLAHPRGTGVAMIRRGDTIWVTWDHWRGKVSGGRVQTWRVPWGGWFALSPDGALASGDPRGVTLLPEPDTELVSVLDGLPGNSVRFLRHDGDELWVSTWQGGASVGPSGVRATADQPALRGLLCPDDTGTAWTIGAQETTTSSAQVLVSWRPGEAPKVHDGASGYGSCDSASDGSVWLSSGTGLWNARDDEVRRIATLPDGARLVDIDRHDRLWTYDQRQLCRAPLASLPTRPDWSCVAAPADTIEGIGRVLITDDETALVSTQGMGLMRIVNGRLQRHPRSDEVLGSRQLHGVSPSPRGGVWVFGEGVLLRVQPDTLTVLERLEASAGVRRKSAGDVLETPDGHVWIASAFGVTHVPPSARRGRATAPPVHLTNSSVNGESSSSSARVPASPNQVQLQFSALAYRHRYDVRYRASIDSGPDRALPEGRLLLLDLAPGHHRVAVQASTNGVDWGPSVTAHLHVDAPWWRSWWFFALVVLALAASIAVAYRTRVALLVTRERERTVIAMDLHDQLGSGLGSIQLIASVLDRDGLDDSTRHDLANRIRATATDLHAGLQGLVSSLRPGGSTVAALLDRLGERARNMFPDPDIDLRIIEPKSHARTSLSLPVCRELERIGAEALHNAARHGHPRRVTVGIEAGAPWTLRIADDGVGFDPDGLATGLGMESMRHRAARIGGTLDIVSVPGEGTVVIVTFQPDAKVRPVRGDR